MEVTQGIVLPVLVAAIIANTVILALVVLAVRGERGDRLATTRSALEGSLMSTSFVDRSDASSWGSNGESHRDVAPEGATDGEDDEAADELDEGGARAVDEAAPSGVAGALAGALAEDGDTGPDPGADPEPDPVATTDGFDALTGLLDHPAFTHLIAGEDVRTQRYHRPATVVIFELGGLDRLVERLGSEAADRVIPALADTMRRLARDVDHVGRLAPGRFGVLLPETDEIAAINYVERVRRACELWLESGAIALNLAVGWAGSTGDPTLIECQRLATDRMYVELRRDVRKAADL